MGTHDMTRDSSPKEALLAIKEHMEEVQNVIMPALQEKLTKIQEAVDRGLSG